MSANQQATRPAPGPPLKGRTPLGVKNVQSKTQQQAQDRRQHDMGLVEGAEGMPSAPAIESLKPLPAGASNASKPVGGQYKTDKSSPKSHRMSFLHNIQRSKVFNNLVGGERLLAPPSPRDDGGSLGTASGLGLIVDGVPGSATSSAHNLLGNLRTPKKRAIPREDTHPRNVVDADDGSPPHKKSRSSKDSGSGSTGIAATATQISSTGGAIASAVDKMQVDISANKGTPPATPALLNAEQSFERTRPLHTQSFPHGARDTLAPPTRYTRQEHNVSRDAHAATVAKNSTTQRIDKISRMSATERAARDEQKKRQAENWKRKYTAEFPKMTFYLDGFDEKTKSQLARTISGLGGSIEPFFSKSCTHLLSKHIGNPSDMSGDSASASTSAPATASQVLPVKSAGVSKSTKQFSPSKKGVAKKNKDLPLHSDRNPFDDVGMAAPTIPSNSVVAKAYAMGLHVWPLDKFWQIANLLLGQDVTQQSRHSKADLAQLLRHEQLHGTSERDVNAPREGWKYFDKDSFYIFIEDATREHRAIMAHQFEKPTDPQAEPPWPKLYGEAENRCPFSKTSARARDRDRTLVGPRRVDTYRADIVRRFDSPMPPTASRDQRGASPFQQLASGNSVSVASHMTTSAIGTPSTTGFPGGYHGLVGPQDKRVAQLNRRMVSAGSVDLNMSTGGDARNREGPSGPHARGAFVRSLLGMRDDRALQTPGPPGTPGGIPQHLQHSYHTPQSQHYHPLSNRSVSLQRPIPPQAPPHTPGSHPGMTRSISLGTGTSLASRNPNASSRQTLHDVKNFVPCNERVPAPGSVEAIVNQLRQEQLENPCPAPQDPAAEKKRDDANNDRRPYCENCRVYFDELEEHTLSNRHRKFALNDANFVQIDALIRRVERPQAPWVPFIAEWLSKNGSDAVHSGYPIGVGHDGDACSAASRSGSEDPPLSACHRPDISFGDEGEDGEGGGRDTSMDMGRDGDSSLHNNSLVTLEQDGNWHEGDGAEDSVDYNTSFVETEGHLTPQTSPEASVRPSVFVKHEERDDDETSHGDAYEQDDHATLGTAM